MKRLESDMADHYGALAALQKKSLLAEKDEALESERAKHEKIFEEALSQRLEGLKAVLDEEFVKQLQVCCCSLYFITCVPNSIVIDYPCCCV